MENIELSDVQGSLVNEYPHLKFTRYVMLQVTNGDMARIFIKNIVGSITSVTSNSENNCLNIAFTSNGLRSLGLREKNIETFTREFREGMVTPHRQRLLGDFDSSDPNGWMWGGPQNDEVHMMLMVFGIDKNDAEHYYNLLYKQFSSSGFKEVFQIDGQVLPGNKEHFGFRDGISQPYIKGSGVSGKESDNLNAGEFLMGYKSEYNVYPDTPFLAEAQGDTEILHNDIAGSGYKDLGRNGSYLVLRQLQQDTKGYWNFINEKTKDESGAIDVKASNKLAAKMMGRWPSGAPLVKWPDEDPADLYPNEDPEKFIHDNDFFYNDTDKHGMKCPFGAHIRRTNPRDSFEENTKKKSILLSNRHRIIRRARMYGESHISSPTDIDAGGEVGMLFACFNADIARQFEFIQYTWANYPKFKQLVNDPDPFIGVKENPEPGTEQVFTIPHEPVNKYVTGMQRFVHVRGGSYFFFPSITTIKYFATLEPNGAEIADQVADEFEIQQTFSPASLMQSDAIQG
jgi:Dyp-type peroxidase family